MVCYGYVTEYNYSTVACNWQQSMQFDLIPTFYFTTCTVSNSSNSWFTYTVLLDLETATTLQVRVSVSATMATPCSTGSSIIEY